MHTKSHVGWNNEVETKNKAESVQNKEQGNYTNSINIILKK